MYTSFYRKVVLGGFLLAVISSVSANGGAREVERDLISYSAFDNLLAQDPPPTRPPVDDNGEGGPRPPPPPPPTPPPTPSVTPTEPLPTVTPTESGAPSLSNAPTSAPPSKAPSTSPSMSPSANPTKIPSSSPSSMPSPSPSAQPSTSVKPSVEGPTTSPSITPTGTPSVAPSANPSSKPSVAPSSSPSKQPSLEPSSSPSSTPTKTPSASPTQSPSSTPSSKPTSSPSINPTAAASISPTTSKNPTAQPSIAPSRFPTRRPTPNPTRPPTRPPTGSPTRRPTIMPTFAPTSCPDPTSCLRFQAQGDTGFFAIQKCAASCDFDIQCARGLTCYKRSRGQTSVPGCIGDADSIGTGDYNFCVVPPSNQLVLLGINRSPSSAYPLRRCAGDCDRDSDCGSGLFCFERNGLENIPGCIGSGQPQFDYCYNPGSNFRRLNFRGDQEWDFYELGQCEGDCDFDSDCAIGHVCYERNAGDSGNVPTCVGNANTIGFANDDYCIPRPRSNTLISVFENEADGGGIADGGIYPIPFCAGDCDTDADCFPGLSCFQRSGFAAVPGCSGEGEEDYDYCV